MEMDLLYEMESKASSEYSSAPPAELLVTSTLFFFVTSSLPLAARPALYCLPPVSPKPMPPMLFDMLKESNS